MVNTQFLGKYKRDLPKYTSSEIKKYQYFVRNIKVTFVFACFLNILAYAMNGTEATDPTIISTSSLKYFWDNSYHAKTN